VSAEELRGKTDYDIFPRETAEQLKANDLLVLSQNLCQHVEEKIPQRDGYTPTFQ
jgi:hypothetical protein